MAGATLLVAAAVAMARWSAADLGQPARPLPPQVETLLSDDTPRKQTAQCYAAFRECFATDEDAIKAVQRNTGVVLPYLNVPSNIRGNYAYLVEILGRDGARDVCAKNPGVLSCNPKALRTSTADEITRAADGVEFVESLPIFRIPLLRNNLDKIIFFAGASVVAKRLLIDCAGASCGGGGAGLG